jgi:hypothetical protein
MGAFDHLLTNKNLGGWFGPVTSTIGASLLSLPSLPSLAGTAASYFGAGC